MTTGELSRNFRPTITSAPSVLSRVRFWGFRGHVWVLLGLTHIQETTGLSSQATCGFMVIVRVGDTCFEGEGHWSATCKKGNAIRPSLIVQGGHK